MNSEQIAPEVKPCSAQLEVKPCNELIPHEVKPCDELIPHEVKPCNEQIPHKVKPRNEEIARELLLDLVIDYMHDESVQ